MLLALTLATGCTLPIGAPYTGATPEDVVLQKHGPSTTIIGARTSGNTSVVLATDPAASARRGEVYVDFVIRSGLGWNVPLSFTTDGTVSVPPSAVLCYATAEVYDKQGASTFVYGYVRQPDAEKVEIDFSSGQMLEDKSGDGMFAVIQPSSDAGTTIRALDGSGNVIHSVAISAPRPRPSLFPAPTRRGSGGGRVTSFTCTP